MKRPNKYQYTQENGVFVNANEYIDALEKYIDYLEKQKKNTTDFIKGIDKMKEQQKKNTRLQKPNPDIGKLFVG